LYPNVCWFALAVTLIDAVPVVVDVTNSAVASSALICACVPVNVTEVVPVKLSPYAKVTLPLVVLFGNVSVPSVVATFACNESDESHAVCDVLKQAMLNPLNATVELGVANDVVVVEMLNVEGRSVADATSTPPIPAATTATTRVKAAATRRGRKPRSVHLIGASRNRSKRETMSVHSARVTQS